MFRLQIVLLSGLGLAVGVAAFAAMASTESAWVTVDDDKRFDDRVSFDEDMGVYLVHRGPRVIAFSNHGPWNNELVVYCPSSQLFETYWSGSKFDIYGHYLSGPAPRGMNRLPVRVRGGKAEVIPKQLIAGPSRGVSKRTVRLPVGPFCVP